MRLLLCRDVTAGKRPRPPTPPSAPDPGPADLSDDLPF